MKKTLPAAAFISTLIVVVIAGLLLVNFVGANPIGWEGGEPPPPRIEILSPKNNGIYTDNALPLTFTVYLPPKVNSQWPYNYWYPKLTSIEYRLDGVRRSLNLGDETSQSFLLTLTGLSDGAHTVDVIATALWTDSSGKRRNNKWGYSIEFFFTVDTTSPSVSILSLQGSKYDSADASLNFTVSEQISWVGYSLDGKAPVTITEDTILTPISFGRYDCYTVLTGVPEDAQSLKVHVKDSAGHIGESASVSLINQEAEDQSKTEQRSEPLPTTLIAAAIGSVTVVSVCLIVYFKKRKKAG